MNSKIHVPLSAIVCTCVRPRGSHEYSISNRLTDGISCVGEDGKYMACLKDGVEDEDGDVVLGEIAAQLEVVDVRLQRQHREAHCKHTHITTFERGPTTQGAKRGNGHERLCATKERE